MLLPLTLREISLNKPGYRAITLGSPVELKRIITQPHGPARGAAMQGVYVDSWGKQKGHPDPSFKLYGKAGSRQAGVRCSAQAPYETQVPAPALQAQATQSQERGGGGAESPARGAGGCVQVVLWLATAATTGSISNGCFRTVIPSMFLMRSAFSTSTRRVVIVIVFPSGTWVSRLPSS